MPFDNQALANILLKMSQAHQDPQGSFEELLANFMNASNHGNEGDMSAIINSIDPNTRQSMVKYGRNNQNPQINPFEDTNVPSREFRDQLIRLLSR